MIFVEALLFDLDGTLIDSKRDLAHSVQFIQKRFGMPTSTEHEVGTFIGDGVVKLVERALPQLPKKQLEEAVATLKVHYREHCLDHTGLYPGVLDMLRHFRHKKMAIVTNKPFRISGYILDHLRLTPFFDVLIGGDSLPNKKPHPEPILSALATIGLKNKKHAVFIGDSANDVESARAAKIRSCGVISNIGDPAILAKSKPDFVLNNMKELVRLFK